MGTLDKIREFANSLRSDRLIKIKIGSEDVEPFLISQRRLENASEYFRKALRQDSFKEGRTGQIDFPKDYYDEWAVLVFWMMNTCYNQSSESFGIDPELLINRWVLGDKYEIPEFQDQIMLELLSTFEVNPATMDIIRLGSEVSPADSVLKRLVAEEAARALAIGVIDFKSLEIAFSGNEMLKEFVLARDKLEARIDCYDERFKTVAFRGSAQIQNVRSPNWRDYMLSNGSRPQWLLDEIEARW